MLLGHGAAHADPAPQLAELVKKTDAVAKEVAKIRGLRLKRPIPHEVVDRATIRARLVERAARPKEAAEIAADGIAMQRWGLIPDGTDYAALQIELLTEQIAGYYDPEIKKLTVSEGAGDNADWLEMVLAHELDHGLQDQAFDLKKFLDLPATEGDAESARHALVEGDGIGLMLEVTLSRAHAQVDWADPAVARMVTEAMNKPDAGNPVLEKAPLAVRETALFPYRAGFGFVAALRRHKSWAAVDAAFARPPASTEQVLHPERYLAREAPIAIAASAPPSLAAAGYAVAASSVWGELGWQLWLRSHAVDDAVATDAAAGWGGDRALVLALPGETRGSKAIGLARSEWDTLADAVEAAEAATKALDASLPGAAFAKTDAGGRWVAADGTVAWIARKDSSIVIAIGVPAALETSVAAEAWTSTGVAKKKRR